VQAVGVGAEADPEQVALRAHLAHEAPLVEEVVGLDGDRGDKAAERVDAPEGERV
jgi:hypothetical protein